METWEWQMSFTLNCINSCFVKAKIQVPTSLKSRAENKCSIMLPSLWSRKGRNPCVIFTYAGWWRWKMLPPE